MKSPILLSLKDDYKKRVITYHKKKEERKYIKKEKNGVGTRSSFFLGACLRVSLNGPVEYDHGGMLLEVLCNDLHMVVHQNL